MTTTNKTLVDLAIKYLGTTGKEARKYCGLGNGQAWCDAFITWLFYKAKAKSLFCKGTKQTYCPNTIRICKSLYAEVPMYLALPGDVILFDWDRNNNPNHIGMVEKRVSTDKIKTIEGNTDGGKVARKTRPAKYVQAIYRIHYKPTTYKIGTLAIDGKFGYSSIANLQKALGITVDGILGKATVRALQKKAGMKTQDGHWGKATSKKVQKMVGAKQDGVFGPLSVKALQKWINKQNKKPAKKPEVKHSYKIMVNLTNQVVTLYDNGKPIKSEWCSTAKEGKSTPVGTWKIQKYKMFPAKRRTARMSNPRLYAEYIIRFLGHKCQHTVPYKKRQTTGHVNSKEFNKLGQRRSAGCVRVPWAFAKYCYDHCPIGTPYIVYRGDKDDFPMGMPPKYHSTNDIDPTYKR